jgi:exopolysaccharide biosynthesis polyprenyl glycosylphosphotransferase|tara:strand:- start:5979 stop:7382 length:1404 start_codon:yes stop_codon:yes gene_type:complete
MPQQSNSPKIALSEMSVATLLLCIDVLGIVIIFNFSYWAVVHSVPDNLLLTWKLILISSFTFLCYYLMDLYTFESSLVRLGMLERSLIGMVLVGFMTAIFVYISGPAFIGGFVGRGVLALSLALLWLWSLGFRYLLNIWLQANRSQIEWLVLINEVNVPYFISHFRSIYKQETLLFLVQESNEPSELDDQTRIVGNWDQLNSAVRNNNVAGVIVVSRNSLPGNLVSRLMRIRIEGIRVYDLNDFYEKFLSCLPVFNLDQNWIAMSHGFDLIHNPIGLRFKRYLDILISLLLGILLIPLMLLLAVLVVVTMGRPILYSQVRRGENGSNIRVRKFRSMIVEAEDDGAQFTQPDDPRVTPFGNVLRKFRLDELPQLWNVLIGEMSFIGPRPERPESIRDLQEQIPYYNLRHIVKPGITGWAQVMHGYGDSVDDAIEKLQYDLFYIKNYSLTLDVAIIIKSMKVVLFGAGR